MAPEKSSVSLAELVLGQLAEVKSDYKELEMRVRALEIAQARLIGYAAGGAFIGGLVWQVFLYFTR